MIHRSHPLDYGFQTIVHKTIRGVRHGVSFSVYGKRQRGPRLTGMAHQLLSRALGRRHPPARSKRATLRLRLA